MIGGLAGAAALNIVHQSVKQFCHAAPRVDLVGEEALSKGLKNLRITPPSGDRLFLATLAGDLLSNTLYYSLTGFARKKQLPVAGATAGLAAGIGALCLTKPMGLSDVPVTRTLATKLMTVGYYTLGGLVAGLAIKALRKTGK